MAYGVTPAFFSTSTLKVRALSQEVKEGGFPSCLGHRGFGCTHFPPKELSSLPGYRFWAGTGQTGPKLKGWRCQAVERRAGEFSFCRLSYSKWSHNELPENLMPYISLKGACTFFISSFWFSSGKDPQPNPLPNPQKVLLFLWAFQHCTHFWLFQCSIFLFVYEGLSGTIFPPPLCFAPFSWLAVIYSWPHILWQLTCEFLLFCYELSRVCSAFCSLTNAAFCSVTVGSFV